MSASRGIHRSLSTLWAMCLGSASDMRKSTGFGKGVMPCPSNSKCPRLRRCFLVLLSAACEVIQTRSTDRQGFRRKRVIQTYTHIHANVSFKRTRTCIHASVHTHTHACKRTHAQACSVCAHIIRTHVHACMCVYMCHRTRISHLNHGSLRGNVSYKRTRAWMQTYHTSVRAHAFMQASCMPARAHVCMRANVPVCMHACMHARMRSCMRTFVRVGVQ